MRKRWLSRAAALLLVGIIAAMAVPACTIRLQQGNGDESEDRQAKPPGDGEQSAPGGAGLPSEDEPGDDEQTAPGGAGLPSEDEEDVAAFMEVLGRSDPHELALLDLKTQYAASALAAMVQEQVGADPEIIDPAVVQQIIDAYAPLVWEQAEQWVNTLDPSTVELARVVPREECVDKWDFGCRRKSYCDFHDGKTYATCLVTGCGEGRCPVCPRFLNLDSLIFKGWCSYTCMRDRQIIGIKIRWYFQIAGEHEECRLLETPVPLEP